MKITRNDNFPMTKMAECIQAIEDGKRWIVERYPDVEDELDQYEIILKPGNIKSRHFDKERKIILARSNWIGFYARACREIGHGLKEHVGIYDREIVFMTNVIHELTHAVQTIRNFHRGNETDTTLNELAWLKQHKLPIYWRCFDGKTHVDLSHATIERKRKRK